MGKVNGEKVIASIVINMMANISMIKNMDMVYSIGKVGIYLKAIIKKMREMGMEKCIGRMVQFIKVTGSQEYSMDLGNLYFQMEQ